jgi:orotidine-5'-phosphate decarboxylase
MKAAKSASAGSSPRLLGGIVLTSYDDRDLAGAGCEAGLSARVAPAIRASLESELILVTPGFPPAGTNAADQKRTMTPAAAILLGADYLVVGRPVT